MSEFTFTCLYCNHKWKAVYYFKPNIEDLKCPICNDKNLKVKKEEEKKKDFYE